MTTIKALEPGEFDELLAELDTHHVRDALVACLLHDSALRIDDALTVRLIDFSPDRTLVRIYNGKHRAANEYDTVPVSNRTIERLDLYLADRPRYPGIDHLIVTSRGKRVHQQHYRRLLARVGMQVLGKHVHPHMLRHTSITALACDHNIPLPVVQKFARHRRLDTTQQYLHVRPGWSDEVRAAFG